MTIAEACRQGIQRVRKARWRRPDEYLALTLRADGPPSRDVHYFMGPWARLYSAANTVIGQRNPQEILILADNATDWEPYTGPLDAEDKEGTCADRP